jgi:formate hydrogenlyase subunit 6/NADH:ubiquinone oxidoreductase subunit I
MKRLRDLTQTIRAMSATLRRGLLSPVATSPTLPFRGYPVLRSTSCTGCHECVEACPTQCIRVLEEDDKVLNLDWRRCMCCGICVEVCPENAIDLSTAILIVNGEHTPWP